MKGHLRLLRAVLTAAVIAATFAWAPPAAAATITVTSDAQAPGADGDCTLGEAIQAANTDSAVDACSAGSGDDVISLSAQTFTLSQVDHVSADGPVALPEIESTITINGANPSTSIIQRNSAGETPAFMLFHMSASTDDPCWPSCTLTLQNVAVQGAKGLGGAVTNKGGHTVFHNAMLAGNTEGPAVWTTGDLVVRSGSLVTNNESASDGGVFKVDGDATIEGVRDISNNGSAGDGGVLAFGAASTVTVSNSEFSNNRGFNGGVFSGSGTLAISGSEFKSNMTLGGSGGALGDVSGDVRIVDSYFLGNGAGGMEGGAIASTGDLEVTGSTFKENTSDVGGAISSRGTSASLANSTFSGNGANVKGGAVFATGGATTIANSTFADNFGWLGGGFAWEAAGGTLALRNSLLATNSGGSAFDCSSDSAIASQGYNLVGDATGCSLTPGDGDQLGTDIAPIDPMLGSLDLNGGTTLNYSLLPGSPAIDRGNPAAPGSGGTSCEQLDQRGQVRPRDGDGDEDFRCDIGSWEGGVGLPVLSVEKTGTGTGAVQASGGTGIACGSDCVESYPSGTSVTLIASATADSEFGGWTGCDSVVGGDQCVVSMSSDTDRTVSAEFIDIESILSVTRTGAGHGTVTSDLAGINCGEDCDQLYPNPTTVVLTATPALNSNFQFWSGCDSATGNECTVELDSDRSVFASFSPIMRTLSVNKNGTGSGTVTSQPTGIDCGDDCSHSYQIFTEVTLTAVVDIGSEFGGWTGCDSQEGLTCTVSVDEHQGVSARFTPIQETLTVTKEGASEGTITSSPAGIDCPGTCSTTFDQGATVTLTAQPGPNVEVTAWTGCTPGSGDSCSVEMGEDKAVSATFAPTRHVLSVTKDGRGSGTVSSAPAGIACGDDCNENYAYGTSVVLTAVPGDNMELTGWQGCDSTDASTCTVGVDGSEDVTATFQPVQRTLTLTPAGTGTGTVTSEPTGIDCGTSCSTSFDHGTSVTLTAAPGPNSVVSGWSGCDSSLGAECSVSMTAAKDVTVTFALVKRTLSVQMDGSGSGSVSSTPAGITCGADCSEDYDHGTEVVLTALPAGSSAFDSWTGCDSVDGTECTVAMTAAESVTATFTNEPRTLTVVKDGAGSGSVSSSPAGIDCGSTCSQAFDAGTEVVLTATPAGDSTFAAWTGCDSVTANECTLTMSSNRTATATFDPTHRTLTVETARAAGDLAATGSVTSDVGSLNCTVPNECTPSFEHGTVVVLTAEPGPYDEFVGWTGCDSVEADGTCSMTMSADKSVNATFHNTSAPSSSITTSLGPTSSTTVDLSYEATAGDGTTLTSVELWVDGPGSDGPEMRAEKTDGADTGSFTAVALDEGDGLYEVTTRARNDAGNYEEGTSRVFTLDTVAPASAVSSEAAGNTNTFDLTWNSDDDLGTTAIDSVELWVDGPGGGGWKLADTIDPSGSTGGVFTFTVTEGSGDYSFYSRATDAAGNREDAPETAQATVSVSLCAGLEDLPGIHVVGTGGKDKLFGTGADEVFCGGAGNDLMRGGGGSDTFDGGSGKDTVTYSERSAKKAVVVTLDNKPNDGQNNEGDNVGRGVESVIGGKGNDTLKGNGGANVLKGGVGNDTLKGNGGADKLYGQKGKDKLIGGPKKDVCRTGETYKSCEVT